MIERIYKAVVFIWVTAWSFKVKHVYRYSYIYIYELTYIHIFIRIYV